MIPFGNVKLTGPVRSNSVSSWIVVSHEPVWKASASCSNGGKVTPSDETTLVVRIEEISSTIITIGCSNGERNAPLMFSVSNESVIKSGSPPNKSPHGLEIANVNRTFGIFTLTLKPTSSDTVGPGVPRPARLVSIEKSPMSTAEKSGFASAFSNSFEAIWISLVSISPTSVPNSIKPSEVRLNTSWRDSGQSTNSVPRSRQRSIFIGLSERLMMSPINRTKSLGITSIRTVVSLLMS